MGRMFDWQWQRVICSVLALQMYMVVITSAHFFGLEHVPAAGNLAVGRTLTASSTCGFLSPESFCSGSSCSVCDSSVPSQAHPPSMMADRDAVSSPNRTWWQSVNNVAPVTLELSLGATFFFTHMIISFRSPRPDAMVLEKSIDSGRSYQPIQYYSSDCVRDFNIPDTPFPNSSPTATCTSQFSSTEPRTNGEVMYLSAPPPLSLNLTNSNDLNRVTLTNLRVRMLRHSVPPGTTDTREVFFAVYNFELWGWCFCSGHSEACGRTSEEMQQEEMVPSLCTCANRTTGVACERCQPLSNASPWSLGYNSASPSSCQDCDCHGHSSSCRYSSALGGGECLDCSNNTSGRECEQCAPGYFRPAGAPLEDSCQPCDCHPVGSLGGTQCTSDGQCSCKTDVTGRRCDQCTTGSFNLTSDGCQSCSCSGCEPVFGRCPCPPADTNCCPGNEYRDTTTGTCVSCGCHPIGSLAPVCSVAGDCSCKPGVGGVKCNECLPGFFGFSETGCSPCDCHSSGSDNEGTCDRDNGQCDCRIGVIGRRCDQCPPGTLGPSTLTATPCINCFCNGYSRDCKSDDGWYMAKVNNERSGWSAVGGAVTVSAQGVLEVVPSAQSRIVSVLFPSSYLEDKRTSFSLPLSLRANSSIEGTELQLRVEMRSAVTTYIISSPMQLTSAMGEVKVMLTAGEFRQGGLYPGLDTAASEGVVHRVLSNIADMRLVISLPRVQPRTTILIDSVSLPYATANRTDHFIETPLTEVNFVEQCDCSERRTGRVCQRCSQGYTMDDTGGEFDKCVPCNCLGNAEDCDPITMQCIDCKEGTEGIHCERCSPGYYPSGRQCLPCSCPGRVTSNSYFGTGCSQRSNGSLVCSCQRGYEGSRCDQCSEGFFGTPGVVGGRCEECDCALGGAISTTCNKTSGQCQCREQFNGRRCSECADGFWDPQKNGSCVSCGCHPIASQSQSCDQETGHCSCNEGVTGDKCERCIPAGTTGVFPSCEVCGECSNQWNRPISSLRGRLDNARDQVSDLNRLIANGTRDNNLLLRELQQLLVEIESVLSSRTIVPLTGNILTLYSRLCNLTDQFQLLLQRADVIRGQVSAVSNQSTALSNQVDQLVGSLNTLTMLLANLSREAMLLAPLPISPNTTTQLELAETRSNSSNDLVRNNVTSLAGQTESNIEQLLNKEELLRNLQNETRSEIAMLRQRLQQYIDFILSANTEQCGSTGRECGTQCGGLACERCGGIMCSGLSGQLLRAENRTGEIEQRLTQLNTQLMAVFRTLNQAANLSREAGEDTMTAEQQIRSITISSRQLLVDVQSLLGEVQSQLGQPLPNVSLIGILQSETLALQLLKTPEEVNVTVTQIVALINMIGEVSNITEEELRTRVDRALNTSRRANETATVVLSDVARLTATLNGLQRNRTEVVNQTTVTRAVIEQARNDTDDAESSLDRSETVLDSIEGRVTVLRRSLEEIVQQFETNRQRLATVRNLTLETDRVSRELDQESQQRVNSSLQIQRQAVDKRDEANRNLAQAQNIQRRTSELRLRTSEELQLVEDLLNRRQCIEEEQQIIRGDLQRVAAQLEAIRNNIRMVISRNTVCQRRSGST